MQKYFIKLANAGLPVPGRIPNLSKCNRKKVRSSHAVLQRKVCVYVHACMCVCMCVHVCVRVRRRICLAGDVIVSC